MTTSFPTGLDALTNPTGSSSLTSPDHAGQHADANDAIEALQAKVGVNGSAVTTSLDYKVSYGIPSGVINMWATTTAPTSWLLCDGTAVSRTTYAALFSVINTTYGSGDGSTTFNLPNLKGKVPVGRDSADVSFDTMGESGGAKTHTLTSAESGVPAHGHANTATFNGTAASHTHTQNAHTHTQNAHGHGGSVGTGEFLYRDSAYNTGFNSWVGNVYLAITWNGGTWTSTATNQNTTATNQNTSVTPAGTISMNNANNVASNASSAHNNLQPYIVLNYIIKI